MAQVSAMLAKAPLTTDNPAETATQGVKIMTITPSTVNNIARKLPAQETIEYISSLAEQIEQATAAKKFGSSKDDLVWGFSLAASIRDPEFWRKMDTVLHFSFR